MIINERNRKVLHQLLDAMIDTNQEEARLVDADWLEGKNKSYILRLERNEKPLFYEQQRDSC